MPHKDGKGPAEKGMDSCIDKHGNVNAEQFSELFTRAIRGELNNIDDPRGGYTPRGGYRKTGPQPGPGPFHGETTHYGLDDVGQGEKK